MVLFFKGLRQGKAGVHVLRNFKSRFPQNVVAGLTVEGFQGVAQGNSRLQHCGKLAGEDHQVLPARPIKKCQQLLIPNRPPLPFNGKHIEIVTVENIQSRLLTSGLDIPYLHFPGFGAGAIPKLHDLSITDYLINKNPRG